MLGAVRGAGETSEPGHGKHRVTVPNREEQAAEQQELGWPVSRGWVRTGSQMQAPVRFLVVLFALGMVGGI